MPKYEGATSREVLERIEADASTNVSLWLESFPPKHKQEDLGNFSERALRDLKAPSGYASAYEAHLELLRSATLGVQGSGTRLFEVQAKGRFVVGLGAASVSETGMQLLRPWGVPYLPGSSLKGIASAAAHARGGAWASPDEAGGTPGEHHESLFGSVERAGCVIFHDAWWKPAGSDLPLELDVMTPHHTDYNLGDGKLPLDTDSPNPVSFLTCTGSYLLALTGPADWLDLAWRLLQEALEDDGIGAKTAAGYGRFELVRECEDPEVVRKREAREGLARYEQDPPTAGQRDAFAAALRRAHEELPDEEDALVEIVRRITRDQRKSWKKWFEVRADDFGWVSERLFAAPESTTQARASEHVLEVQSWLEKRKDKKKRKAKAKLGVVYQTQDGAERHIPVGDIPSWDKLQKYLRESSKNAPKLVRLSMSGAQVVDIEAAE